MGNVKKILLIVAIATINNSLIITRAIKDQYKEKIPHRITIFIHGTNGTMLGLLNPVQILNDTTHKTTYEKIQKKWRHSKKNHYDQLMDEIGFHKVKPHLQENHTYDSLVQPLVWAYHHINQSCDMQIFHDKYYTFGWNGLLSQRERRFEAIRLYNAISELYKNYEEKGLQKPLISLACHSHGCNVALYLGLIHLVLNNIETTDTEQLKIMSAMKQQFDEVGSIRKKTVEKKEFYKRPTQSHLKIDELIMLAGPIQQETEWLAFSPLFKNVYNIYSDNDPIQVGDYFSTIDRNNRRKIAQHLFEKDYVYEPAHVKQIRIKIPYNESELLRARRQIDFSSLLRGGSLISTNDHDPGHKDFWCVTSNKNDTFYDPLPMVVLAPIILATLDAAYTLENDLDLIINNDIKNPSFTVKSYNQTKALASYEIQPQSIETIRNRFKTIQ